MAPLLFAEAWEVAAALAARRPELVGEPEWLRLLELLEALGEAAAGEENIGRG